MTFDNVFIIAGGLGIAAFGLWLCYAVTDRTMTLSSRVLQLMVGLCFLPVAVFGIGRGVMLW